MFEQNVSLLCTIFFKRSSFLLPSLSSSVQARHSRHKYRPEIFPGEADSSKNRASEGVLSLELSSFNNNDAMASFLQENDGAKQETQVEVQAREPGLESSKTNGDIAEVTKSENENKAAFTEVDLGGQE